MPNEEFEGKIRIEYAKFAHAEWLEGFKGVKEIASYALCMMFLVNGGALIAIGAFLGNVLGKMPPDQIAPFGKYFYSFVDSMGCFVVGIIFAGLCTLSVYINFSFLGAAVPSSGEILDWLRGKDYSTKELFRNGVKYAALAGVILGLFSLLSFAFGCYLIFMTLLRI
jgi:magnesium-transporting ATPase (P-type)